MKIKRIEFIIVILLTVVSLAPIHGSKAAEKLPPIKVGALMDYTGIVGEAGQQELWGLKFKLDEIRWKVAGRRIVLIDEDSGYDTTRSMDKVRKLVEHDKVDVVIGPMSGPGAIQVGSYLKPLNVPNIAFLTHPKGVVDLGYVFLPIGQSTTPLFQLGIYAYKTLGYRTVTVLRFDALYTKWLLNGFRDAFESLGGTVIQEQIYPFTLDFSPFLVKMKKVDALVLTSLPTAIAPFLTQYHGYGLKMPIVAYAEDIPEASLEQARDLALGMIAGTAYVPTIDTDINKRFVTAFTEKYGLRPDPYAAAMYSSLSLFLAAVEATEGDTTGEKIIKALKKVKLDTPAGYRGFNGKNIAIHDRYIVKAAKVDDHYRWRVMVTYRSSP